MWPNWRCSHVSGGSCALCYSCRDFQYPELLGTFWGWLMGPHSSLSLWGGTGYPAPHWNLELVGLEGNGEEQLHGKEWGVFCGKCKIVRTMLNTMQHYQLSWMGLILRRDSQPNMMLGKETRGRKHLHVLSDITSKDWDMKRADDWTNEQHRAF